MKQFILSCVLSVAAIAPSQAQQTTRQLPVYLDQTKPVEQRIDDAISRMTLAEKIRIIHAQSKSMSSVLRSSAKSTFLASALARP